jgi:hypothetical protein
MMIEPHGQMDYRLKKQPRLAPRRPPHVFEHFVTLEVLPRVEQLEAAPDLALYCGPCFFRYHSSVSRSPSSNEYRGA